MRLLKNNIIILISLFILLLLTYAINTVYAIEGNTQPKEVDFKWEITENEISFNILGNKYTLEKNGVWYIDGENIEADELLIDFEKDRETLNYVIQWINENPVNTIIFSSNVKSISLVGNNSSLRIEPTEIIIGENTEHISAGSFDGFGNLSSLTIYSRNVILDDNSVGFSNGEKNENLIIYGYKESTVEYYAKNNGFVFVALEEHLETIITTVATTSNTTTTTTTESDLTLHSTRTTTVSTSIDIASTSNSTLNDNDSSKEDSPKTGDNGIAAVTVTFITFAILAVKFRKKIL